MTIYGQEMDVATAALARMNMILHNNPTAEIKQGNTLSNPMFLDANSRLSPTFAIRTQKRSFFGICLLETIDFTGVDFKNGL